MSEFDPSAESEFSLLLKYFRKRSGLSQTQLAAELGVSRNTVTGWETGTCEPGNRRRIDLLAQALKLSPHEKGQLLQSMTRTSQGMPDISNLRSPRDHFFTDRDELLVQLGRMLGTEHVVALVPAGNTPEGIGKTALATEYIYRHLDEYSIIWWVKADNQSVLLSDYNALYQELGLCGRESRRDRALEVIHRLKRRKNWLLVMDNVTNPQVVRPYLPNAKWGQVLIISGSREWHDLATVLPVDVLEVAEAAAYLLESTGLKDQIGARALARRLECVPLALHHAASWLTLHRATFDQYLSVLDSPPVSRPASNPADRFTSELALQEISHEHPAAAALLDLCAMLAPDDIPLELLTAGGRCLPSPLNSLVGERIELRGALDHLADFGLVSVAGDQFSIHRSVQEVLRWRLKPGEECTWVETALRMLLAVYPLDNAEERAWTDRARLQPHALAVAGHLAALAEPPDAPAMADLAYGLGQVLRDLSELNDARAWLERALAIYLKQHGPDHPLTARTDAELGRVLLELGELVEARGHLERALMIYERSEGAASAAVGTVLSDLGNAHRDLGELETARTYHLRALDTANRLHPRQDHRDVARALTNLGLVQWELGELAPAETALAKALEIASARHGQLHRDVATGNNNLGLVRLSAGRAAEARRCFEEARAAHEAIYGHQHPYVARDLHNLGLALAEQGDLTAARGCLAEALAIDKKVYGSEHPDVAADACHLGEILWQMGDIPGARSCLERALRIDRKAYGEQNPAVARDCLYLSLVLLDLGDLNEARACAVLALEIDQGAFGLEGAVIAADLGQLGRVLQALGDLNAARHLFERALAIVERTYGPEHVAVASDAFNLGIILMRLGTKAEAHDYLRRALDIVVAQLGPEHPDTLAVRAALDSPGEEPYPLKTYAGTDLPGSLGRVQRRVRTASGRGIEFFGYRRPTRPTRPITTQSVLVTRLPTGISTATRPGFHRWLLRPTWPLPRDRAPQTQHIAPAALAVALEAEVC